MSIKMEQIMPDFEKLRMTEVKGQRLINTVTFNPDRAEPGEEIYVTIPKLKPGVCIVPNSLYLSARFKNKNTKSWFLNNLGKLLVEELTVKVGGEVAYDNIGESFYRVYEDLWKSSKERSNMVDCGIANQNTRKLMSKDDTGDTTVEADAWMNAIIGNRVKIKLGQILNNHGVYAPYDMNSDIQYKIRLPKADTIMRAQNGQSVAGYSLEGLELEYETIESPDLASQALNGYEVGRSLSYEHVTLLRKSEWSKDSTLVNETINLPRKSMKAIVMLFKVKEGATNSEKYFYPSISGVKITVEGIPNAIFSQGMKKHHFFTEARRFFLNRKRDTMPIREFYTDDHFALVIDLRSLNDGNVVGSGKKIINAQSGVLVEITKVATNNHITCYTYVVSDGIVNIVNKSLQSIEY